MSSDADAAIEEAVNTLRRSRHEWSPEARAATARTLLLHEACTEDLDPPHLQYDDCKAPTVIAAAWKGNEDAEKALRGLAAGLLRRGKPLPPNLSQFVTEVLDGRQPASRRRGQKPGHHVVRDTYIAIAVSNAAFRGFRPTRNRESSGPSACTIVAQALNAIGEPMGERRVEKIWGTHPLKHVRPLPPLS